MRLIVGLGNPGKEFSSSRHNSGFFFLDYLKKMSGFSNWVNKKLLEAEISTGNLFGEKIILAKPQTFMNSSGRAVKKLIKFYKVPIDKLLVIHDDIDIQLGLIKVSKNRGSAGHKGVESIIKSLDTNNFTRIRIGIQPKDGKPREVDKFVLEDFSQDEQEIIQGLGDQVVKIIESIIRNNARDTQAFNK